MIMKWAKRWVLVAVGLPVAAWALDQAGDALEERKGSSSTSRRLHQAAGSVRDLRGKGKKGRR